MKDIKKLWSPKKTWKYNDVYMKCVFPNESKIWRWHQSQIVWLWHEKQNGSMKLAPKSDFSELHVGNRKSDFRPKVRFSTFWGGGVTFMQKSWHFSFVVRAIMNFWRLPCRNHKFVMSSMPNSFCCWWFPYQNFQKMTLAQRSDSFWLWHDHHKIGRLWCRS